MLQKAKQLFNLNIDYKNRVVGFDMLRGVGILIVLYGHGRSKIPYFPEFNNFISVLGFWLIVFFQSAITPTAPFLEESWTLCIEEWFYLLFPILLLVGNWLLVSLKLLPKNIKWNVFVSILILIFCPMALRFYAQSNKMFDWLDITRMTFF
ncbi:MAG: hypothetical protein IPH74_01995 [Bacteroidetes bacterium]|nr:hypothetical protein [Bacteroidota bacterium]